MIKLCLESIVAFVAAYALCIGIAPVIKLSPMFVGIGAALAYFVYQRMSIEEYEYYYDEGGETGEAENKKTFSAPSGTLLGAYERSTAKAQNNLLEHLWESGEMQDFLQMKGCYAPSLATATTSGSMAEINDDIFDFDASEGAEQTKDEDGLISPIVDKTPARPNMATAIDEENFDLFDDELELASAPAVEESTLDCCAAEEDDMFFDDSLLDEYEEKDDDIVAPQEPGTEKE